MRTAPLTAGFGLFVIFTYAISGIFAPIIAPYGEAEVISSAFAPADENMLLGADQLGRDMFSRIIYGARNTVGLALLATILAFAMGATAGLYAAAVGGKLDQAAAVEYFWHQYRYPDHRYRHHLRTARIPTGTIGRG
jgi:peptide/nickel transport system permease protein